MEHRVVGGVGGVGAVDAAERHDPQRRLTILHDANLHGARLRPEQQRIGPAGDCEIEVVERVASRVLARNRQGLEVVPLIFDLGPVYALEAQPAHDLLNAADRLGDRMEVTEADAVSGKRDVDRRHRGPGIPSRHSNLRRLEAGRDRVLRFVELLAAGRFVGWREATERFLDCLEAAALGAKELNPGSLNCRHVTGQRERCLCILAQPLQFGAERVERHGCHGFTRPRPAPAG